LSSAILFLAIVAIWACVLVPRWLRRSHEHAEEAQELSGQYEAGQPEAAGAQAMAAGAVGTGDFDTLREQGAAVDGDPVAWEEPAPAVHHAAWRDAGPEEDAAAWEEPEAPAAAGSRVETSYSVTATYSTGVSYSADTADPGAPAGRYRGPEPDSWCPQVPARPPGQPTHVLRARRRMLCLLIVITVAAMGAAFVGLTPWWTTIAPFVMLGGYLMLLHEAARADAERAHRWAEARARAVRAARAAELERQRARRAEALATARPTAQIINLSALAAQYDDNPYDQYADAEIRAVGD
jgi:membrane protein implicated in regulation of membrane protease activity